MTPQEAVAQHLEEKGWCQTSCGDYDHNQAKGIWLTPKIDALIVLRNQSYRYIPYADPAIFEIIDSFTCPTT